jgi:hypothetical protein
MSKISPLIGFAAKIISVQWRVVDYVMFAFVGDAHMPTHITSTTLTFVKLHRRLDLLLTLVLQYPGLPINGCDACVSFQVKFTLRRLALNPIGTLWMPINALRH